MHHLLHPMLSIRHDPSLTNNHVLSSTNPTMGQINTNFQITWRARMVCLPHSDQILYLPLKKCYFLEIYCMSSINSKSEKVIY